MEGIDRHNRASTRQQQERGISLKSYVAKKRNSVIIRVLFLESFKIKENIISTASVLGRIEV